MLLSLLLLSIYSWDYVYSPVWIDMRRIIASYFRVHAKEHILTSMGYKKEGDKLQICKCSHILFNIKYSFSKRECVYFYGKVLNLPIIEFKQQVLSNCKMVSKSKQMFITQGFWGSTDQTSGNSSWHFIMIIICMLQKYIFVKSSQF